MTILLTVLHIAAAVLILIGRRRGILHIPVSMLTMTFFLPLWGPACALAAELHYRGGEQADEEPEAGRFGITDEVYRSIRMENDDVSGVLPIEDVLVWGSPVQRRNLLLSVLHGGAEPFVKPLRTAGVNDDTEVVHYAVTALVELRSEFAQRLAEMEARLQEHPADPDLLLAGADLDEEYLASGIPEDTERRERISHCRATLEKVLHTADWEETVGRAARGQGGKRRQGPVGRFSDEDRILLLKRLGRICLLQQDFQAAEQYGRTLVKEMPDSEEGYLLVLEAKAAARDGRGVQETLETIRGLDIYLSPAAREKTEFWSVEEPQADPA